MTIFIVTHTTDPTSGGWGRYTNDLKQALIKKGHTVVALPDLVPFPLANPIRYLRSPLSFFIRDYWILRKAIAQTQPDVIHITVEPYLLFIPFIPLGRARIVLTIHGTYAYIPTQVAWPWRHSARRLFTRALQDLSHIISVSEYTKNYLLNEAKRNNVPIEHGRITTIHNGIDVERYTFRDTHTLGGKKKQILTVAPVKSRKGIHEAIRALGEYKKKYREEFSYHVIGSYDSNSAYVRALRSEIHALGLDSDVLFLGRVSEKTLHEEYSHADLFLMLPIRSSAASFEGFGLVYLEANACGVPTIGSLETGSAEAISNGVSGLVVDAKNANDVADSIHNVLQLACVTRADARAWAESHDISTVVQQVCELYSSV